MSGASCGTPAELAADQCHPIPEDRTHRGTPHHRWPAVQLVEYGHAILAAHDALAVEIERACLEPIRSLDDEREAVRPVGTPPGV